MSRKSEAGQENDCTGISNERLVADIQAGDHVGQNMAVLYGQVRAFIRSVAWRYRGRGVELEDLEQEGFLALYDAVAGYDPEKGTKFLTYAGKWINQKMVRYIQANGSSLRLSYHRQEKQREYARFRNTFEMENGRRPTEAELAFYLGLTLEQVRQTEKNACRAVLVSLDSPVTGLDVEEESTVGEFVASAGCLEDEALERIQQEELSRVLWECVDSLPEQQTEVIRRRYQGGETLRQIGEAMGIPPAEARKQEGKALRELRAPSRASRLLPFFPEADRVYSMGITGVGAERFQQTWTSSTERVAIRLAEKRNE